MNFVYKMNFYDVVFDANDVSDINRYEAEDFYSKTNH